MRGVKTFRYNNAYTQFIVIGIDSIIFKARPCKLNDRRVFMNKLCVMNVTESGVPNMFYNDPFEAIDKVVVGGISRQQQSLYFAPECKIPRDIIRNSGYKITINKDNADYVVVPYKRNFEIHKFDIFATKDDDIYLFCGPRSGVTGMDYNKDAITQYLTTLGYTDILFGTDVVGQRAFFVPKFDIYEEIFNGNNCSVKYVYEKDIEVEPNTIISMETLNIWKHITDDNMRAKLLLASDCRKYPLTTMYFCDRYWWPHGDCINNEQVKRLFEMMDYDTNKTLALNLFVGRLVDPDDWSLLTKFILNELGLPETGGYVKNLSSIHSYVLRNAICVAPFNIKEPTPIETIKSLKQ